MVNRFLGSQVSSGLSLTFSCGGDELLGRETSSSSPSTFFLNDEDTGLPVMEVGADGTMQAYNVWGANGLPSRHTASQGGVFYAFDPKGSPAEMVSQFQVSPAGS